MIEKRILPEDFNFDVPSVEIIGVGSKGMDKQAMVKRASADAFADVIAGLEKKANRTYLHVITTGAQEYYGSNRNGDSYNEGVRTVQFPYPENQKRASYTTDCGLRKYHDASYMDKKAAVYQEHRTEGVAPSGEIIAARYNDDMHRGELIIAVDTEKWAPRLEKKASGQNIYLSIGATVPYDVCEVCGRIAKTASEHCDHFKHSRCQYMDDGTQCTVINDAPHFYDISGVDVPADRIAFVLSKVASGEQVKTAAAEAYVARPARRVPMFGKVAAALAKLSRMEKRIEGLIEGDKVERDDGPDDDAKSNFILRVEKYPVEEIVDVSNRKGLLLPPEVLFKLMGKELEDGEGKDALESLDEGCCGDMSCMMRELEEDEDRNDELQDGSFDQHFPADLNLDDILNKFLPEFGTDNPAIQAKIIRITVSPKEKKEEQHKEASFNPQAEQALRKTYARYLISFAERNSDQACMNALMKVAALGK